jgi:hypothetical protein
MAVKLTQGQKAGLIFGGAVLTALLIVGKAEGAFDGLISKSSPPKAKLPPVTARLPGNPPPAPVGEFTAKAKPTVIEGCDPLGDFPPYVGCYDINGVWTLTAEAEGSMPPAIKPSEIGVSNDFSDIKIGAHWVINELYPFLEAERQADRLAVYDYDAGWVADLLYADPVSFVNDLFGWNQIGITKGDAVMLTAYTIAAGGLVKFMPLGATVIPVGAKLSTAVRLMAAGGAQGTKVALAAISGSEIHAVLVEMLGAETGTIGPEGQYATDIPDWMGDLLASAEEAFFKLLKTKTYLYGYNDPKKVLLGELPQWDFPAVGKLYQYIFAEILRFQRRKFTWPDGELVT